ncbi:MAG: putative glycosyltransferase, exosortase G system-associated [Clostridia bacterium]|nr:putative glycosyltransferase, exosortase G system-associated [Clostridia bacterium]
MLHNKLFQQFLYWGAWLIIPFLWEIAIGFLSAVLAFIRYYRLKEESADYYPRVSVLIPVYNSQNTLDMCLQSIVEQDYPKDNIEVFLIDNGSKDGSYNIFIDFQEKHPDLKLWWYNSEQGKSKALNKGIFSSSGKYVINIDSDGCLDKNAIKNVVKRFESDDEIACMTGVILIDPGLIQKTKGFFLKMLRVCELFEYSESFLVGRNFQSTFNSMYTLAGAFSCFKREALMKTQMYNCETIGEDTHMTFQIRNFVGGKTVMCENAFFYVDPIENLDKLYIQRQRWQRAELEVASLFTNQHMGGILGFITKPTMRKLVSDHTLTFPRLIWFFAMIYLYFINYPLSLLIGANVLIYISYVLNSFVYLGVSAMYLKQQSDVKRYILKRWYMCFVLPLYRFVVYWVRVAGIINSLTTESRWRTQTFTEEINALKDGAAIRLKGRLPILRQIRKIFNNE